MKPTEKQIKVIDTILSIINTWKNTNDIYSPTHSCDMREFIYADLGIDDIITPYCCKAIEYKLRDLLFTIQIV